MRCLTMWQPFASLVACGAKTIETRSWGTAYRGLLAIHASKKMDGDVAADCEAARSALAEEGFTPPSLAHEAAGRRPWGDSLGRIVAVARLQDCRPMESGPDRLNSLFGTFGPGRWGWLMADIRPLPEPILMRGMQGLFSLAPDVVLAIGAQLEGVA